MGDQLKSYYILGNKGRISAVSKVDKEDPQQGMALGKDLKAWGLTRLLSAYLDWEDREKPEQNKGDQELTSPHERKSNDQRKTEL